MEFAFTTDTYAINGNTCVGIWCKEGDYKKPFASLTVNLDLPLIKNTAFIDVNNLDKRLRLHGTTGLVNIRHGRIRNRIV